MDVSTRQSAGLAVAAESWNRPKSEPSPEPWFREPRHGRHIPALDGLRGLAVILVMMHHWTLLSLSHNRIDLKIAAVLHGGWVGVELFFVLSGFLITGILLDARGKPHFFRDFYARRTLRIFPLYYAFVFLFMFLVLPADPLMYWTDPNAAMPSQWWYWTYCSNFMLARNGFYSVLDPTWSLAIEEQFYWIWPLVVLALPHRRLITVCFGLLAFSVVLRAVLAFHGAMYPSAYVLMPSHMDGLLVGAIIAMQARSAGGLLERRSMWLVAGGIGAVVALGTTILAALKGLGVREYAWTAPTIYTALSLLGGVVLIHAAIARPGSVLGLLFGNALLRKFGKYSYAMYLFNMPIHILVQEAQEHLAKKRVFHMPMIHSSHLPEQLLHYVLCMVAVYTAAFLSWHLFEVWFLKLKKFFPSAASDTVDTTSLKSV
jgi:peptidoglycan/LPS O-acetylase OafA/YrhL